MDMQLRQIWPHGHFKERTPVKLFLGRMCVRVCVLSQSSVRDKKTWKSKALLIYHFQIHFVCFVLIFSLFLFLLDIAFHFCSIHDMPVQKGRVKLCDGDYTIKKEIGNTVSLSTNSMFFMLSMSCSNGGYVGCAFTWCMFLFSKEGQRKHIGLFHFCWADLYVATKYQARQE